MLAEVAHQSGDGGVIAVNRSDAMPLACNSAGMKRAVAGAGRQPFIGMG
jgi:isoaspartyl peptidase/L-asparaginase-like protein (Ntn-hydrolase superfamily)